MFEIIKLRMCSFEFKMELLSTSSLTGAECHFVIFIKTNRIPLILMKTAQRATSEVSCFVQIFCYLILEGFLIFGFEGVLKLIRNINVLVCCQLKCNCIFHIQVSC